MISVRPANEGDFSSIWRIFRAIVVAGDTYAHDETLTEAEAYQMWLGPRVQAFVAVSDEQVVGAYKLVPNMPGRGAHVANGSYIVDAASRGLGVGRMLVEHSLQQAGRAGYKAIQFNCVVTTNRSAIRLYERYGFRTLATIPKAFLHRELGYVDTLVMYRSLDDTD